jgi:glycosyltransferase involved in cell wall biosynthesis
MRILVDYRPALRARTGAGEYVHELVRAYTAAHTEPVAVFSSSWKDRPAPDTATRLRARVIDRRIPVRILNYLWHRTEWPPIEVLAGPWDVVHAAHPLLIPARHAAQVVTVHDLFFLAHPERTQGAEIARDYAALAGEHTRRALSVITPSMHTARLVVARLGVSADRVYVCSPGAPTWGALGALPNAPEGGYFLFVGTLETRKNVGVLLEAYARLVARTTAVPRLVLAGRAGPGSAAWLERLSMAPLQGRVDRLGYVPEEGREQLYAGARALILPSLDEGFGITALEAMSAGVPVVASTAGALPEVVGDAGVLVEPTDVDALATALERIVAEPAFARDLGRAGLERARAFTWTATAHRVRRAYADACDRRRGHEAAGSTDVAPSGGHA